MLIACPSCATTYQIDMAALGAAGRSVRCAQCRNTWFATAADALPETVAEVAALPPAAAPFRPSLDEVPDDMLGNFSVDALTSPDPFEDDAPILADAPSIAPDEAAPPAESAIPKFEPAAADNIETIAARRARHKKEDRAKRRHGWKRLMSMPLLIIVLTAVLAAIIQWRGTVVRYFPQTASLFSALGMPINLRGLAFENVRSTSEFHDGVVVLIVDGSIVNKTNGALEIPRLRFALRNATGHEVYAWSALPAKTLIGPGDGLPFRTRLASPPPDGRDVIVRFFNRRDIAAGMN